MNTYRVEVSYAIERSYEVQAETEEEAVEFAKAGGGILLHRDQRWSRRVQRLAATSGDEGSGMIQARDA